MTAVQAGLSVSRTARCTAERMSASTDRWLPIADNSESKSRGLAFPDSLVPAQRPDQVPENIVVGPTVVARTFARPAVVVPGRLRSFDTRLHHHCWRGWCPNSGAFRRAVGTGDTIDAKSAWSTGYPSGLPSASEPVRVCSCEAGNWNTLSTPACPESTRAARALANRAGRADRRHHHRQRQPSRTGCIHRRHPQPTIPMPFQAGMPSHRARTLRTD